MLIRSKSIPAWALISLVSNILLIPLVALLIIRDNSGIGSAKANMALLSTSEVAALERQPQVSLKGVSKIATELGPRHRWTYEQWVMQLKREAQAMASQKPKQLTILAGDSLSLWFPPELLPLHQTWLNQGISGETSIGLLRRLKLFDRTQPQAIFVMIGINDLIRGISDQTILSNYHKIIQDLKWIHPDSQIVVQSILPHSAEAATWEGRDRLLEIPNDRIRLLNQQLETLVDQEGVTYLDLYSLFADQQGNLRTELSTDGLHLNDAGYLVWSAGLQLFSQTHFKSPVETFHRTSLQQNES